MASVKSKVLYLVLTALLVVPLLLASCSGQLTDGAESTPQTNTLYQNITPQEASELINSQDVVVIDLRTVREYYDCHIPGARLIQLSVLDSFLNELNQSDKILVYWSIGGPDSEKGARILAENGFTNVWNLEGGFVGWLVEGLPVTETEIPPCAVCS